MNDNEQSSQLAPGCEWHGLWLDVPPGYDLGRAVVCESCHNVYIDWYQSLQWDAYLRFKRSNPGTLPTKPPSPC